MKFSPPLEKVTLLRRYKRFMADVVRADGSEMTVHCANTGSMKNCVLGEPQQALISDSGNPKRKYRHTLEALQVGHGHWAEEIEIFVSVLGVPQFFKRCKIF